MKKFMGVCETRSSAEKVEYSPRLLAKVSGQELVDAMTVAIGCLNVGVQHAGAWGVAGRQSKFTMGKVESVVVMAKEGCYAGTTGEYPSANMLLLVDGCGIELDRVYPAGASLCIVHCKWIAHQWKHDLPMQEGFYRSLRRTFVGWLETILRQQGF